MILSKFLDIKTDIAFRRILGTGKNKNIFIHFLNDILGFIGKNAIQESSYVLFKTPDIAAKKQSIVDVLCRAENRLQVIIEMQVVKTKGFKKRTQY